MKVITWIITIAAAGLACHLAVADVDMLVRQIMETPTAQFESDPPAEAALRLSAMGESAFPTLLEVLSCDVADARRLAAWALGIMGDVRAAPGLAKCLADENGFVRAAAEMALVRLGLPAAESVCGDLHALDSDARIRTARILGAIGAVDSAGILEGLLTDDAPEVRCAAIEALGCISVPGAAVKMVPLLKDEDYTVRQRTVWALRKTLTTERLSELLETHGGFLVAQLDDPNELTCRAAVEIMGLLGESSAGLAIRGLNSKSSVGRRNAAKALLQIQARDVRALGPLLEALVDMQDDALRAAAAGALGYIGDARAVMPLIEALKDHEIHVRLSAIKSLGLLGDNRAVAELAGIVNDQKAEIRLATVKALGEFGDAAVEILSAKLKDDDPEIRDAVAESLGKIGDPRSEQALLAALEQIKGQGLKKNASRCIIVKALGQIHSGKDVIEALLRLLETTPRRNDATLNAVNRALENITGACVYSGIIYPDCGYNNLLQDWQKWWRDHEDDFTSQPKNGI
ncbi:MAG: HEAT repeat domain-containing protein [Kiritimatiellia bacterium]|jgi:HEAT repeat protein